MPIALEKTETSTALQWTTFRTALGWMAIAGRGNVLHRLTFGHEDAAGAVASIGLAPWNDHEWQTELADRLTAFADGQIDDFLDVEVAVDSYTPFTRRVVDAVRNIPQGQTLTYGEVAALAGNDRAARAVGRVMSSNRIPLIIPCHRVVGASGKLVGFSAIGGVSTKKKLLEIERRASKMSLTLQNA
ncbi:MAG: MGMT family protein [Planctomycetota bacterium]|nr:MGMT family protein [Planctomycetota bacterium]